MSVRTALPALLILSALTGGNTLARAGAWNLAPGEHSSELRGTFFTTGDFYDDNGDRTPLGVRYEHRSMWSNNELGWKKHTEFLIAAAFEGNTAALDGTSFSETTSGLSDIRLGFRRQLIAGARALAVQADWEAPLGYNRHNFPGLGDGLQTLGASILLGGPLAGRGFYEASVGLNRHFLSLIPNKKNSTSEGAELWANQGTLSVDAALWASHSVLVGANYVGLFTVSHGDRLPDEAQHLVGPVVVLRVDEHLDVMGGSYHTASGKNVLHVNEYYVAVAFKNTKLNRLQGFLGGTSPGR
jgi:hypothetical protein